MATSIRIRLNEKLFLRDPEETELGRKIVAEGVKLIDQLGFEQFTFKKLAVSIESTEASIYRYFENKHKFLIYIISWYWVWLDYQITFHTHNIKSPEDRLRIIIHVLSEAQKDDPGTELDESALYRIVVNESAKAYLTKEVDIANTDGLYREYKNVCRKIADIVHEVNPAYPYAHSLVSMVIEASHHQIFFAQHLPSLTDIKVKNRDYSQLEKYLEHVLFSAINTM